MAESSGIAAEYAGRATLLLRQGQAYEAYLETRQGLNAAPRDVPLLVLLVDTCDLLNRTQEGVEACLALAELDPRNSLIQAKIGELWTKAFDYTKAEQAFQAALALDPKNTLVLDRLADLWRTSGKTAEAKAILLQRAGASADVESRAANAFKTALVQPVIARSNTEIDEARSSATAILARGPEAPLSDPYRLGLGPNFYSGYQARDDRRLQEGFAGYYRATTPSLAQTASHVGASVSGRRIRVGLVSHYFYKHTVGYLAYGLAALLDRTRFELVLFRTPNSLRDGETQRFATAAPLIDLAPDLGQARRQIADARLDVLHFPEIGMEPLTYFLAFARLATLQTVAWGHPITTGIPNIDLFLSCDAMEPAGADAHYSERLMRLKTLSVCVEPPSPPKPFELQIDKTRPSYLCAQSLFKLHPDFDATLAALLHEDRRGIVYFVKFLDHPEAILKARLAERLGPDIDRVRILPRMSTTQFLHLVGNVDVVLDVPQWSGGKTSLEALAMGTPVIHWPGEFMRGRHTLAFYRRMGVEALVVDSSEGYVATAIRAANDDAFRKDVRAQIAANSGKLFNDVAAVREIENVWETALSARC